MKILDSDIHGAITKWEDFKLHIAPLCTSGNIAFMGSASKADNVPDETITRPVPLVQAADVFNLYNSALNNGFILNENKVWIPTNEDPIIYDQELQQALGNWYCVADFFVQILDLLYLIGNLKSFCSEYSSIYKLPDINHVGGGSGVVSVSRTPGQLIQMFPNTNAYISSKAEWTHLDTKRIYEVLDNEYFYWVSRMEIEYIQEDPLLDFTIGSSKANNFSVCEAHYDENTGEFINCTPISNPSSVEAPNFIFNTIDQDRTIDTDIFIGLNFSSYTTGDGSRVELPLTDNAPHWIWKSNEANQFGIVVVDPTTDPQDPANPDEWVPNTFLNIALYLRVLRDDR